MLLLLRMLLNMKKKGEDERPHDAKPVVFVVRAICALLRDLRPDIVRQVWVDRNHATTNHSS
jgi:hypothetical protein